MRIGTHDTIPVCILYTYIQVLLNYDCTFVLGHPCPCVAQILLESYAHALYADIVRCATGYWATYTTYPYTVLPISEGREVKVQERTGVVW